MTYALLNADQILQFGSDDDSVALAPLGTVLPTSLKSVDAAFKEVGWFTEDGMVFTPSDSVDKRKGHQGHRVYRTVMTDSSTDFGFTALQSNLQTLGIQWNVKESKKGTGGESTHILSNARDILPVALVVQAWANGHHYLWAASRFEIGERNEFSIASTGDTAYQVKGTFASDIVFITDDPAFQPAGA